MPLTWILFITATIFLYGIGQVFTKKGTTRLSSSGMLLLLSFNMLVIYGGAWLFFHNDAPIHFKEIAYTIAATFLSSIGYIFFYEAVERQKISIVGTVTAAYPFITVILAIPLLNEPLTISQILAIAVIHITREDIPAELSVSFFCFGGLSFYTAISYGCISIVTALADLYPFVTVIFAQIMLSEKLEKHCQIAVALALLGISVLALG
jgi:drug/metabolite transporter (DMT)-like permease